MNDNSPGRMPLIVFFTALVMLALCWALSWELAFLAAEVTLISIVIWQACDPFADAAQWLGVRLKIPGSVRGATLDAVASSMPELFSGIFFVLVAVTAADSETAAEAAGAEGYGATIATCAGSAVFNMILIPAICALVISCTRPRRPTIDVEAEVLSRDGLWFVGCELVLILFLFQERMHWWMGAVFLVLYFIYVAQLARDARIYAKAHRAVSAHLGHAGRNTPTEQIVQALKVEGIAASFTLIDHVKQHWVEEEEEEREAETASALFGFFTIRLGMFTACAIIACSTLVAATACYFLVEATNATAELLDAPVFFVAVILAAAASSVPDTFLSVMAARRGDDSGAVSNAFGSNIFDICICLSIPLLVNSYLVGWQPVSLTVEGKPLAGLVDLQILLALFTVVTLLMLWHNRQLTRKKALLLCGMYGLFIAYAIAGSLGYSISRWL